MRQVCDYACFDTRQSLVRDYMKYDIKVSTKLAVFQKRIDQTDVKYLPTNEEDICPRTRHTAVNCKTQTVANIIVIFAVFPYNVRTRACIITAQMSRK